MHVLIVVTMTFFVYFASPGNATPDAEKMHNDIQNSQQSLYSHAKKWQYCTRHVHYLAKHYQIGLDYQNPKIETAHQLLNRALNDISRVCFGNPCSVAKILESCLTGNSIRTMVPLPEHVFSKNRKANVASFVETISPDEATKRLNESQAELSKCKTELSNHKQHLNDLNTEIEAYRRYSLALKEYSESLADSFESARKEIQAASKRANSAEKEVNSMLDSMSDKLSMYASLLTGLKLSCEMDSNRPSI